MYEPLSLNYNLFPMLDYFYKKDEYIDNFFKIVSKINEEYKNNKL